jgi:hypothetical protein
MFSARVVQLDNYRNRELLQTIERILESAKRGEITGLAYAIHLDGGKQCAGVIGDYIEDPGLGMVKIMDCLVEQRIKNVLA